MSDKEKETTDFLDQEPEPFDWGALDRMVSKTCGQCGNEFQGLPDRDLCIDCEYRRKNPDQNDGYWTWKRAGENRWDIVAFWPDHEPEPDTGMIVTVHRKDGTASSAEILEIQGHRYLPNGRRQMQCIVRNQRQQR